MYKLYSYVWITSKARNHWSSGSEVLLFFVVVISTVVNWNMPFLLWIVIHFTLCMKVVHMYPCFGCELFCVASKAQHYVYVRMFLDWLVLHLWRFAWTDKPSSGLMEVSRILKRTSWDLEKCNCMRSRRAGLIWYLGGASKQANHIWVNGRMGQWSDRSWLLTYQLAWFVMSLSASSSLHLDAKA